MSTVDILYGALCYNNSYNLGDNIQTLAAIQYLPRVDVWIDRDTGDIFDSDGQLVEMNKPNQSKIKVIYNGWFDGQYCNFPPPNFIDPLFISFHINETNHKIDHKYDILEDHRLSFRSITLNTPYFEEHGPVGCRDLYTLDLLKKNNIDAYFSACLTLTLKKENYLDERPHGRVLVVDAHIDCPSIYKTYIPSEIRLGNNIKYITQGIEGALPSNSQKIELAKELLREIAASHLIITSRLHTALPAIAFHVPVIFMNNNLQDVRFRGLLECPQVDLNGLYDSNKFDFSDLLNYNWQEMSRQYLPGRLLHLAFQNIPIIQDFLTHLPLEKPQYGEIYQHYRNQKSYKIIGLGKHTETMEDMVIYQALYYDQKFGNCAIWVRPLEIFLEKITHEDKLVSRFTKCS
jgi:hypothetical protein